MEVVDTRDQAVGIFNGDGYRILPFVVGDWLWANGRQRTTNYELCYCLDAGPLS